MLLIDKIKSTAFSPAEQNVIGYLFNEKSDIENMTIQELSERTYVHPSTFIRIAKKLDYKGWIEFKNAFLKEQHYLSRHFEAIDPNLPFSRNDSSLKIAQKMALLKQKTIEDTYTILTHDQLQQATKLLEQAKKIRIFASNANLILCHDFALKMGHIKKDVQLSTIIGEQPYDAYHTDSSTCSLLISYTGENQLLTQLLPILKKQGSKIITLTSIGESTLATKTDCHLPITTRERLYSKIGNFTISTSIVYLLDVLYSNVFAKNYEENLQHLITLGEAFDKRTSTANVMNEPWPTPQPQVTDSFIPN